MGGGIFNLNILYSHEQRRLRWLLTIGSDIEVVGEIFFWSTLMEAKLDVCQWEEAHSKDYTNPT